MDRLYVYILPEHVYSKIDESAIQSYNNEPQGGNPIVGSGPYLVAERQVGQFTRLVANPNYYNGKPAVDEVVFKLYANPDALGQALRKGEIDYADSLEANVFDSLADAPNIKRLSAVYSGFNELAFNNGAALESGRPIGDGNPLLKDKRLREAIGWSLDRKTMLEKVFGGHGSVGSTVIPAMYKSLHLSPPNEVTYDPDKAKSLLDAAGYRVGPDGIRTARRRRAARFPSLRPVGLPDVEEGRRVHQALPRRCRRRDERHAHLGGRPHREDRSGRVRHVRVGVGRRARPELPALHDDLRQQVLRGGRQRSGRSLRFVLLQPRVRQALRRPEAPRPTRPSAPRSSSRCSRCFTTTGRTR